MVVLHRALNYSEFSRIALICTRDRNADRREQKLTPERTKQRTEGDVNGLRRAMAGTRSVWR
jgi:hypothetical protein